jgi:hypothetical protein
MKGREQLLGIIDDGFVQVARMAVQYAGLASKRLDNARVTMTDVRHIVIGIQISFALDIPDPYTLATYELQRLLVEERRVAPQYIEAALEK